MENLLLNQYCQKRFDIDFNTLDDDQKQIIVDTLGFHCYLLSIKFDNLKKEVKKELKRIFRRKKK